jgi:hypothetical protein
MDAMCGTKCGGCVAKVVNQKVLLNKMPQIPSFSEYESSKDIVSASKQPVLFNPNNKVVIITEYLPVQGET